VVLQPTHEMSQFDLYRLHVVTLKPQNRARKKEGEQ